MYINDIDSAFYDIAVDDDTGWYIDVYNNVLVRVELKTGNISIEAVIPEEETFNRYGFLAYHKDKIIIAPRSKKNILIYEINNRLFRSVVLDFSMWEEEIYNLFTGVVVYNNYAYLFPGRYDAIVKLNLETNNVEYIRSWYGKISMLVSDKSKVLFASYTHSGSCVCLPFWQGNVILYFDMETEICSLQKIAEEKNEFAWVDFENTKIWLCDKNKPILICYDTLNCERQSYRLDLEGFDSGYGFAMVVVDKEWVYAIPIIGNVILRMSKSTKKFELYYSTIMEKELEISKKFFGELGILGKSRFLDSRILLCFGSKGVLLDWDFRSGKISKHYLKYNKEDINCLRKEIAKRVFSKEFVGVENEIMGLEEYVNLVAEHENELYIQENKDSCGEIIHKKIIESILKN